MFDIGSNYHSGLEFQQGWGWLVTIAVPIKDSGGSVVGIVACDFNGAMLYSQITPFVLKQLIIMALCLIIGALMVVFLSRLVFSPIRMISGPMTEISRGAGNLTVQIPVKSENEIMGLAVSFNAFMRKLRDMIFGNMRRAVGPDENRFDAEGRRGKTGRDPGRRCPKYRRNKGSCAQAGFHDDGILSRHSLA
jgi:methyl-accepting chemotaxis protein